MRRELYPAAIPYFAAALIALFAVGCDRGGQTGGISGGGKGKNGSGSVLDGGVSTGDAGADATVTLDGYDCMKTENTDLTKYAGELRRRYTGVFKGDISDGSGNIKCAQAGNNFRYLTKSSAK